MAKNYNFGEKTEEVIKGKKLPVWQNPKYLEAKKKAIEIIEKYENVTEGDFWILMRTYASGEKMMYTGLIISHNGCLKLNDTLDKDNRFSPESVTLDKEGYKGSLVYTYQNETQGIFEVGEVNKENCSNAYPYAMAYKRLFDRVVLKLTKIAYAGIYSEVEADDFKENADRTSEKSKPNYGDKISKENLKKIKYLCKKSKIAEQDLIDNLVVDKLEDLIEAEAIKIIEMWEEIVTEINNKKEKAKIDNVKKDPNAKIDAEKIKKIKSLCKKEGVSESDVANSIGLEKLEDLTEVQSLVLSRTWKKVVENVKLKGAKEV